MKVGLDGSFININSKDIFHPYRLGDTLTNGHGERILCIDDGVFVLVTNQVGTYLVHPEGPWVNSSFFAEALGKFSSRHHISIIKKWIYKNVQI